jgi:hypothetical protein
MSGDANVGIEFERQVRALLEEGVQRVGGHARSRLNQARHAALAEAARPRRDGFLPLWPAVWAGRRRAWMPATGAIVAAVLLGFVLWPHFWPHFWPHSQQASYPAVEASRASVTDLDLIADRDAMELMQGGDGQFYEWAMSQADSAPSAQPGSAQGADHAPPSPDPAADQNSG